MRQHPCFSKLKIGVIVTDNLGEKFEVLEIDRSDKRTKLKDLQHANSKFWISATYINKPELLDEAGECLQEVR